MKGIKNEDIERLINPKEVLLEKRQELINVYTESYGRKNKRQIENKMDNAIYIFDSIPTESEFFYDSYKINFNGTSKSLGELLEYASKNKDELFKGNYADLKGINKRQLEEIGVEKIDVCPYCTVLNNDKFFSYRKENQTPKRHSAIIKL